METKRVDMNIPIALLALIDDYQEKEFLSNRTVAILELVRKGLQNDLKLITTRTTSDNSQIIK
ncbi:hypothetical protein [Paenibacillus sp. SI8]|uniref:hypothetical protein n=1 Tax=unclassified Paenibacillus TaxID=185978 RepID=UPI003465CABB